MCIRDRLGVFGDVGLETLTYNDSNSDKYRKSFVQYYHDPVGTSIKSGELRGRAYSPVYGLILFSEDEFPDAAPNDSCYGLTGKYRQARIVRLKTSTRPARPSTGIGNNYILPENDRSSSNPVALVGCAYVPLLRSYILLSPVHPVSRDDTSVDGDTILSLIHI